MVQGERRGNVGVLGESDEADAVIGAIVDEFGEDFLGQLDAALALSKILRSHAAGHVDGHDDIDAAGLDLGLALDEAGLGQGDNEQRHSEPAQGGQETSGRGAIQP